MEISGGPDLARGPPVHVDCPNSCLSSSVHSGYRPATSGYPAGSPDPTGNYLYVKVHKRKSLEPRWTGPYKVLLATPFSVSLLGKNGAEWHHLTHTRKADDPTSRTYDQVHKDLLAIEHEGPTEQPAVQQELPSKTETICGSHAKCVGRPDDPVRAPENLHGTLCPAPYHHLRPNMVLGMGNPQRQRCQRHQP